MAGGPLAVTSGMTQRLVLASTSAARRALFDQVGLLYEAVAPGVDEPLDEALGGVQQARSLALRKAEAVAARHPEAIVVGADQVLVVEGRSFGKPENEAEARDQLAMLAGRSHSLVTGIAVIAPGDEAIVEHEESRLTVRTMSAAEIAAYVATGEWQGCAGSYRLEGKGLALFERIEGDHTNVLGLPMPRVLTILRRLGVGLF